MRHLVFGPLLNQNHLYICDIPKEMHHIKRGQKWGLGKGEALNGLQIAAFNRRSFRQIFDNYKYLFSYII